MLVHLKSNVSYFVEKHISFKIIKHSSLSKAISTKQNIHHNYAAYHILIEVFLSLLYIILYTLSSFITNYFILLGQEIFNVVAHFSFCDSVHGVVFDKWGRWVVVVFHETVDEGGKVPVSWTVIRIFIVNHMDN